jgi:hypothetical protein
MIKSNIILTVSMVALFSIHNLMNCAESNTGSWRDENGVWHIVPVGNDHSEDGIVLTLLPTGYDVKAANRKRQETERKWQETERELRVISGIARKRLWGYVKGGDWPCSFIFCYNLPDHLAPNIDNNVYGCVCFLIKQFSKLENLFNTPGVVEDLANLLEIIDYDHLYPPVVNEFSDWEVMDNAKNLVTERKFKAASALNKEGRPNTKIFDTVVRFLVMSREPLAEVSGNGVTPPQNNF